MNRAFFNGYEMSKSNTMVKKDVEMWDYTLNGWNRFAVVVYLHGNPIAAKGYDGSIWFSCAGWYTSTTRSRLAALDAPVRIKDFQMIRTDTGTVFPSSLTCFYKN